MSFTTRERNEIHPTSKWEEPDREDGLTLWEINRKPRAIERRDRRIRLNTKLLNPHLRCVICLDYLKDTTIVMVCLHRFCSECIQKCIRLGMKECPNCRKFIPSRRSLRRDHKFDKIVQNMVGDPSHRQISEEKLGQNDANKMVHLQRAIENNHMAEKEKRLTETRKQKSSISQSSTPSSSLNRLKNSFVDESPLIEIELRRHPHEERVDRLQQPFLTVNGDAKISLLKKFLRQKLEDRCYEITSNLDDESVVIDEELALIEAKEALCPNDSIMVLKYKSMDEQHQEEGKLDAEASSNGSTLAIS